ncbi:Mad3/BUB1 homology region 1-domain-containing protein, partial [Choanephora cucurbitarum]
MNSEDDHLQSTEEERRQFLLSLIPEVGEVTRSKENVEPRAKGRSIRSLTALLESDPSDREEEHTRVRTQFEQRLTTLDELDDPLQIYLDYLDWLLEYYSQQHTQITDILKQATDQFKQDSRYQFDPRYLKIWIAYAKRIHEPREVYLFLMQQDIGQSLALFYEAYADHEESCKKYEEAAEIYQLGLHKNAMPKKRLERNYHLFQARRREREHRGLSRPS